MRNQLSFANKQLKEFDDINAKLREEFVDIKASSKYNTNWIQLKLRVEKGCFFNSKSIISLRF